MDKDVYAIGFEVKAGAAMRVQDEPFDADAEVATKKILEIDASAPGMIASGLGLGANSVPVMA